MRFLGVLCLLSAAVALPTPEQLHTNLPALPPAYERKSDEIEKSSDEKIALDVPQPQIEEELVKSDESKSPSQSEEKPKVEKDEDKEKPEDFIMDIENESEEKSKESAEAWKPKPEESEEENNPIQFTSSGFCSTQYINVQSELSNGTIVETVEPIQVCEIPL